MSVQNNKRFVSLISLAGLLLVFCAHLQFVESHSLPNLQEVFKSAGLDKQDESITDREKGIMKDLTDLYESDNNLHAEEEQLLNEVGLSKPNGSQKGILQRMYNQHLLNLNSQSKLRDELNKAVEAARGSNPAVGA